MVPEGEDQARIPAEEVRKESLAREEGGHREDQGHSSTSHAEVVVHRRVCDEGEEDHVHHKQPCNAEAWE